MNIKFNDLNELFNYYISNANDDSLIDSNRNNIIKEIEPIYNADGRKISKDLIERCFFNIDRLYFQNTIQKEIDKGGYSIKFSVNNKLTSVAGRFGQNDNNLEIQMSRPILDNLFNGEIKRVEIGGIICNSLLQVFVIIMEHEMTHLIIYLLRHHPYIQNVERRLHHSKAFKLFIYNMFHHLRVTHNLLFGDIDKFEKEMQKAKEIFEIGDIVKCTKIKSRSVNIEGKLVTMTNKYGVIKYDGKYKTCLLRDLQLIKKTEQKNILELLKKKLKIGEIRYIELYGKKVNVQIIDKKKSTFKVKVTGTNKIYNMKYWTLIV